MDIQSEVKCAQCHVECERLEMDVHVYEMHTPKDFVFVCRICNHACVVVEQLLQHYTHRHRVRKQLATLKVENYERVKSFVALKQCQLCKFQCVDSNTLRLHRFTAHGNDS